MLSNISIEELKKKKNITIIDIRSVESYNNNHIPTSINIPANKLLNRANEYLNYHTTYYIYCIKGITSSKVCMALSRMGYKVVNVLGGYEEWILKGD